jgi:hypothetical protein
MQLGIKKVEVLARTGRKGLMLIGGQRRQKWSPKKSSMYGPM